MLEEQRTKWHERQRTMQLIQEKITEMKLQLWQLQQQQQQQDDDIVHDKKNDDTKKSKEVSHPVLALLSSAVPMARSEPEAAMKKALTAQATMKTTMDSKRQKLQQRIEARQAHVDSIQQDALKLKESIGILQQQQQQQEQDHGTLESYAETQRVVHETLVVICNALANHIQQRHSSLLERYKNLDAQTGMYPTT
jgi:hypothetical protein